VTAPDEPRRAVTEYKTDEPGTPSRVVDLYKLYMEQSHWVVDGAEEHGALADSPGQLYTIVRFRAGTNPTDRAAFIAISDDGTSLVTSADYAPNDTPSFFYRCLPR
jgi:hypothetical protein